MTSPVLSVRGLRKEYTPPTRWGGSRPPLVAVDGVDFDLGAGRTLAVVGESGCGKSTVAKVLLGIVAPTEGVVTVGGDDVTNRLATLEMRRRIQLVSQNPWSALNRRKSIRHTLTQPLEIHGLHGSRGQREARAKQLLTDVGLNPSYLDRRPSRISGGELQRITVARALAVEPQILVLDEPTSSLDVSVKAGLIRLLMRLQKEHDLSFVFITHELDVARHIADDVIVMYLGKMVESGPAEQVLYEPQHPYTQALIASIPRADPVNRVGFPGIGGDVPSPINRVDGCVFRSRCPHAWDACATQPADIEVEPKHHAWCHLLEGDREPSARGLTAG